MTRFLIFFCCLFFFANDKSRSTDSHPIAKNMIQKGYSAVIEPIADQDVYNAKALEVFFKKLVENEKHNNQKINIVHIGDSHIQGDLMTNQIRKNLQRKFGNAGRGLVFPYQLAKTNGSYNERFHSNTTWESYSDIHPIKKFPVGLSGIALWRDNDGFTVELNVKDTAYKFNTICIITPRNQNMFDLATSSQTKIIQTKERKVITHKIKKGEVISTIADRYKVSVAQIKRENGLKSSNIPVGRTLKILTNEIKPKNITSSEFVPLNLRFDSFSHYYHSDKALDKIFLIPNKNASKYELNGIVLEKDSPGLIYSSIGVNGSKFSDYNKYPLFFEQLKALHPDMLVLSLGTNESYDHMEAPAYIEQLRQFIKKVKEQNINVPIIISTPAPSLLKGGRTNTYVYDYARGIIQIAESDNVAVWDLYDEFGGINGINQLKIQGLIGPDWVHYSKKGYEKQGDLFTQAFLSAYNNFKLKK